MTLVKGHGFESSAEGINTTETVFIFETILEEFN